MWNETKCLCKNAELWRSLPAQQAWWRVCQFSVTRCWDKTLCNVFQMLLSKSCLVRFCLNNYLSKKAQKVFKYLGHFCNKICMPKPFKNSPIWLHCMWSKKRATNDFGAPAILYVRWWPFNAWNCLENSNVHWWEDCLSIFGHLHQWQFAQ